MAAFPRPPTHCKPLWWCILLSKGNNSLCMLMIHDLANAACAIPVASVLSLGIYAYSWVTFEFKTCCLCRPGMRADFSVFQHNLLETLTGDASAIPEVTATFVDGQCSFGGSAFPLAPSNAPSATPSMAPFTTPSTAASAQS